MYALAATLAGASVWGGVALLGAALPAPGGLAARVLVLAAAALLLLGIAGAAGLAPIPWTLTSAQVPRHWVLQRPLWQVVSGWGLMLGAGLVTRVVSPVLFGALLLAATVEARLAFLAGAVFGLFRALPLLLTALAPAPLAVRRQRHMQLQERGALAVAVERGAGLVAAGALLVNLPG